MRFNISSCAPVLLHLLISLFYRSFFSIYFHHATQYRNKTFYRFFLSKVWLHKDPSPPPSLPRPPAAACLASLRRETQNRRDEQIHSPTILILLLGDGPTEAASCSGSWRVILFAYQIANPVSWHFAIVLLAESLERKQEEYSVLMSRGVLSVLCLGISQTGWWLEWKDKLIDSK